tara:strand:+ start:2707 stop:3474 length:768 start_codon:yes stop_codon:yes gene_type:complete
MADFWDEILGAGDTAYQYLTNTGDDGFLDDVTDIFQKDDGSLDFRSIAGGVGGLASILGSAGVISGNSALGRFLGVGGPQMTGYQGKIPTYTASRMQVPGTFDPSRRPGSSGQRYFTDVDYSGGDTSGAAAALQAANLSNPARQTPSIPTPVPQTQTMAAGGIAGMAPPRFLRSATDGMSDEIPAMIDKKDPAALSGGEFVVPADVVSGIGNGNSDAGAKNLYEMMDKVRQARTGTTRQAPAINADKMLESTMEA